MKAGSLLIVVVSASCLFARPSAAAVEPGDFLVTTSSSVWNIAGGGDFTDVPPFATGLYGAYGICVGPGGDVYVAESDEVTIITAGGDFTDAVPFAFGLDTSVDLGCSSSRVLVTEFSTGEVTDITAGGDFSDAVPFAYGLVNPLSLLIDDADEVWVTAVDFEAMGAPTALWNITAGGDFSGGVPFASHSVGNAQEFRGIARRGELLITGEGYANVIADYSTGSISPGNFYADCYIGLDGGLVDVEDAGAAGLFVGGWNFPTFGGVFEISAGGDCEPGMEFATGFNSYSVMGMAFVRGTCGDGDVTPDEYCDDGGESAACNVDCSTAQCGDGKLNPTAGEDCDDGNVEDGDECPTDCQIAAATTEGSSSDGRGSDDGSTDGSTATTTSAEEPDSSGGVGEASSSESSAADETTVSDPSDGSDSSGSAPADAPSSGCGCRSTPQAAAWAWWTVAALLARRRRRG